MVEIRVTSAPPTLGELNKKLLNWYRGLSALAILVTAYLTYVHFKPSASEVCKISDYFDCDVVNKSIYAELFGIPVAILGLITYVLLWWGAGRLKKDKAFLKLEGKKLLWALFLVTSGGLVFSGYLTYVEIYLLEAICIFCLAQQIIIFINFCLMLPMMKRAHAHHS